MKIDKILVPLDGSALAEAALPKAVEIAKESGASILLIRAAEASFLPGRDPVEAQIVVVREAGEYLDAVAGRLRATGAPKVTTAVWYGAPAWAIAEAGTNADLIVMSTHGRSGLGRLFLGSVAESVLRATYTPILLLRPAGAPVERLAGTAEARTPKEAVHV